MPAERLSMRKTREILRQKWVLERSHREVATSVGLSVGAVAGTLKRAAEAQLDRPTLDAMSDEALESLLYPAKPSVMVRPLPDFPYIHVERKKAGVTLELLHLEYIERHPEGYRYTQFCEHYRGWLARRGLVMRQEHKAGEKACGPPDANFTVLDVSAPDRIVQRYAGAFPHGPRAVAVVGDDVYILTTSELTVRNVCELQAPNAAL